MLVLTTQSSQMLAKALDQMEMALEILDEEGAPGDIAATLDLAIARLRQGIGRDSAGASGMEALFAQLESELFRIEQARNTPPIKWKIPPV